jgi:large subunit ribosomal protein L21
MVFYALLTRSTFESAKEVSRMYAVITTGGKQYKVSPGDVVRVETLDAKKGDMIEIKEVYMIADGDKVSVGKPTLASASVTAEVMGDGRGEKLLIFKHRRRKGFRRTNGHRQNFTSIKVKEIKA